MLVNVVSLYNLKVVVVNDNLSFGKFRTSTWHRFLSFNSTLFYRKSVSLRKGCHIVDSGLFERFLTIRVCMSLKISTLGGGRTTKTMIRKNFLYCCWSKVLIVDITLWCKTKTYNTIIWKMTELFFKVKVVNLITIDYNG